MLGLGLENPEELDALLLQPLSEDAANHSGPPDEEFELADKMHEEADRQRDAGSRFMILSNTKYLN